MLNWVGSEIEAIVALLAEIILYCHAQMKLNLTCIKSYNDPSKLKAVLACVQSCIVQTSFISIAGLSYM